MPAKGFLSREQQVTLQKALKEEEHLDIRERILILLLVNDGKIQPKIADFIGCSVRKVAYWSVHGDPDNLDSLKDKRMEGNHKKATKEYVDLLLKTIDVYPSELGYDFGRWTAKRLATYLALKTGIELSSSQVRRILGKKKYVYIWAKYSLKDKQNPEERKNFKKKLEEYIKISKSEPNKLQIWFWDESGFSLSVLRRKLWGKKGSRKKITGQRRKGRVNVMGAIRFSDKKRLVDFVPKGNSDNFYLTLKVLYQEVKYESILAGNKDKDFSNCSPKILIVLDNASFHKKEEIIEQPPAALRSRIKEEMPNIILDLNATL